MIGSQAHTNFRIERLNDQDLVHVSPLLEGLPWSPQMLADEVHRSWARCLIAWSTAGEIVGLFVGWHVVDELQILLVATRENVRRMGVASRLVQAAFATCEPLKTSLLEVRASNQAAQSLYRKLGFEEFNVRRRYYDDGEDAIEMKLQLPHS